MSADNPLVSVCIPAYKAEVFLEEALKSVREQTYAEWEVIVTEDGSKDRAEDIVRSFARSVGQRVLYTRHATNKGLPSTRNTGIQSARGAWIAFLDADDLWKPSHLSDLVAATKALPVDFVFSGCQFFDDLTRVILKEEVPSPAQLIALPEALYLGKLSILPSSVMLRQTVFERWGGVATDFPYVNDTELWLRVLRNGGTAAYSGNATCLYRRHGAAMSQKAAEMIIDSARLCEEYRNWPELPSRIRNSRPAALYRYAARLKLRDQPSASLSLLGRSLRLQPWDVRSLALTALVLTCLLRERMRTAQPV